MSVRFYGVSVYLILVMVPHCKITSVTKRTYSYAWLLTNELTHYFTEYALGISWGCGPIFNQKMFTVMFLAKLMHFMVCVQQLAQHCK